ncbi:glycoside hydrolase family 51 protein [Sphaerobolus stellatus SS14]|uniref:non-reducing end alpha-L-arabinofuranosidase n=1 Tax=Sphaerobolus stellatus (strain SS14) TaxID=990650 RepID=A0A0C9TE23_SPHS4|nr:glycoside hydrolase family 51 protein [Sphaerobolus stellatus SS14]
MIFFRATALLVFSLGCIATQTTVTVSSTGAQAVPTTLFGATFEEVNQAGDGGIYAELLKNRAFQKVTPGTPESLDGWQSVGGANITVVQDASPVSTALPNSLRVTIPTGKIAPVGFANEGYFGGMAVDTTLTYTVSFFYKFPTASSFRGTAVIGFQTASGLSLGSTTAPINGNQTTWLQVTVSFKPVQTSLNNNNVFAITFNAMAAAGQTIHFAMLSSLPPTLAGGCRIDLVSVLQEMQPGFLRFPGTENLGKTIADRWQWNNTVGPVVNRPGRVGSNGYVYTDGLGLFEFLTLAEFLRATPIMSIYAGLSLDGSIVDEEDLFPFIQQAIDQINFVVGPTNTPQGAMRASLGHSTPFALTYIEIGSQEFLTSDTYQTRWLDFVTILSQSFPQLRFIAASSVNNPVLAPDPTHWDLHLYQTPSWLAQNSMFYDGIERNGVMYLEGEYAAISDNSDDPNSDRFPFPTIESALGEAAFMTGLERNSDIVFGASYSPLFNNILTTQLTPSLISFNVNQVFRSTSFYVQKLFSLNRGTQYWPSTVPDPNGSIFWSVVVQSGAKTFKVVNLSNVPENVTFISPALLAGSGTVTVLNGTGSTSNTPSTPNAAVPVTSSINLGNQPQWTYVAPPMSLSVIRVL